MPNFIAYQVQRAKANVPHLLATSTSLGSPRGLLIWVYSSNADVITLSQVPELEESTRIWMSEQIWGRRVQERRGRREVALQALERWVAMVGSTDFETSHSFLSEWLQYSDLTTNKLLFVFKHKRCQVLHFMSQPGNQNCKD